MSPKIKTLDPDGGFERPVGVEVDPQGNVFVVDRITYVSGEILVAP